VFFRPHFTYIEAATAEQTQAREAAANEEWRKRLLLRPSEIKIQHKSITSIPREVIIKLTHLSAHEQEPIVNPPAHITLVRIIRPRESEQEPNPPAHERQRRIYFFGGSSPNLPTDLQKPRPFITYVPNSFWDQITRKQETNSSAVHHTEGLSPWARSHIAMAPDERTPTPKLTPFDQLHMAASGIEGSPTLNSGPVIPHIYNPPPIMPVNSPPSQPPAHNNASPPPPPPSNNTPSQSSNPFGFFGSLFGSVVNAVTNAVSGGNNSGGGQSNNPLTSFLSSAANAVSSMANAIGNAISHGQIVANAATSGGQPSNPFGAIGSFFSSVGNDITNAASTFVSDVTNAVQSAGSAITGALSTAGNAIKNAASTIGSDITNAAKDVGNAVTSALSTAGKAVTGALTDVGNTVIGALSAANNAIQNAYNSVYGNKIQQEKQQLENQLKQLQQQAQQELNQIQQEKQQVQNQLQQVQQQAQQELNQIQQEKQQVQNQLQQVQQQAQQELSQLNQAQQQIQSQLQQAQQQGQQELMQISQQEQQLQAELQQIQQYEAQAEQMLQQNPNNPQLQSYLQQLQQQQQQILQNLAQLNQAQQEVQTYLQQTQLQAQQELMQINQAQQQIQSQLQLAEQQAQQDLAQLNQAQQQVQTYLQQVQQQAQQDLNKLNQAQQQIQSQLQQAQQQIQQELAQLNKQQQGGNPLQQFFTDVADVSALIGYYATEGLGGVGEELAHLVQGKGLENFSQAIAQFNKAGGQNIAKIVGDVTEVALPAIITAVVAPELLPAELIGEASSVGIGEVATKLTTGHWQSLQQVLQEANEGGVLGAIGEAGGLALESGLAKGAGALTKLLTGSEDLASQVAHLTPVWRAAGGALTNVALQLPFSQNPEQLAIAGIIGGLAGGLGPGIAGKLMSKIDEIRGTGGVAELETLTSPLTGETTEAWKITLPSGDTVYLVPKTTFGEGDISDFVDAYTGKTTLATHVTPSRDFLNEVANGEALVKVAGEPPKDEWAFREWGHLRNLYLSPGESEDVGVALTAYSGLKDTEPGIPEFSIGRSSVKNVLYRFLHPFDRGGIIGIKTDAVDIEPPEELVDYILAKKAEYLANVESNWLKKFANNFAMKELLNDPIYGPMYKEYINELLTYSAEHGEPVIDPEGLLGLTHERQIELAPGAKLRGTGEVYNIWVRQTPELFRNLPGPLRDILSDWSRFKYVGAEIIPGEPLNLFEDTESNETGGERIPELGGEEGGERIPELGGEEGGERIPKLQGEEGGEEGGERILNEGGEWRLPEPILREPFWMEREPQLESSELPTYTSPPRDIYSSPSPISNPPPPIISSPSVPTINPPSSTLPPIPPINSPPSPSPITSPPPSPTISPPPPINSPPSPPSISSPPPINSPPPPPIINIPPSEYIQIESQSSPPPPIFSSSTVTENESPMPMGPPPILPAIMPGGFGGGGNNNMEISGMAGEVIYL